MLRCSTQPSSTAWPTRMGAEDAAGRDELRRQLLDDADAVHTYPGARTSLTPTAAGPGRVDALASDP